MRRPARAEWLWVGGAVGALGLAALAPAIVPTTMSDFFGPGTQPRTITAPMQTVNACSSCHGYFDPVTEPFEPWAASMMGQAARDPLFHACLAIAEQDAAFSGDLCIRCHTPGGWLEGRSTPTNGSGLIAKDMEGVSCHSCHRMVDPVFTPGASPMPDLAILNALPRVPTDPHSGQFVIDPMDRRRGPYDVSLSQPHPWLQSPFHRESLMCATCHDVSNPVFDRQPGGVYVVNELGAPHSTHNKYDQFPLERTFSEWAKSEFAQGPINMGGRFGGNQVAVSSCQDCHMPKTEGFGCAFGEYRTDLGSHFFNGGNTWVLHAIRNLHPDSETNLTARSVADSIARARDMLAKASDLELSVQGSTLTARVTNQTGHKLPTGYPEGRRMWVNVRFYDASNELVAERGAYDPVTATLTTADTKVYEAKLGLDAAMSQITGIPAGESFHFAVNNTYIKDNRIPPRGFTNANFEQIQAAPVAYAYADGQFWDETEYQIPHGATRAQVRVYYQTTSREYIEFLRDENRTNTAGQVAYNQWAAVDKSAPALMDEGEISFQAPCYADCDTSTGQRVLDIFDFLCFQNQFAVGGAYACDCDTSTGPGVCDIFDFLCFQNQFASGCP